jgi:hypothetical protein
METITILEKESKKKTIEETQDSQKRKWNPNSPSEQKRRQKKFERERTIHTELPTTATHMQQKEKLKHLKITNIKFDKKMSENASQQLATKRRICKICNFEAKTKNGFRNHMKNHNTKLINYDL